MLQPGWIGRRVSVRRAVARTEDRLTVTTSDVVGDLLALGPERAVVDTSTGPVEIDPRHVVLARQSPPAARDVLHLEAVAARGWRAQRVEEADGWWRRSDPGGTRRANSALTLGRPDRPLADVIAAARAWYAPQPLLLQIPLQGRRLLDAELREQGWPADGADTEVLAVRTDVLARGADPVGVELDDRPDEAWWTGWRPADADLRALVTRHPRVVFASVRRGGRAVAVARGVADDGWLGITALQVADDHRRQGSASALMAALAGWAREEHGARYAYAQVLVDNLGAHALYRSLGFWSHHDYRYLSG